jgi:hypothetical protein
MLHATNIIDYLGRAEASEGEFSLMCEDMNDLDQAKLSQVFEFCEKGSRQVSHFMQRMENNPMLFAKKG